MSNGWPLVPMEEIFEIARGGSPRPIDSFLTDDPDGVNWVMISDATESGKYINSTKKRIREEGVKRSRVVGPGDFLLTNSMSFGRPYIMNTSGCIHDGWLVLSPRHQNVSPDFFYHLLGSDFVYAEFVRRAAGATVKNLNIDLVKGVQVPLPPMEEQRRIAEVLDRTEALRAKRRAALARLDSLTQSIFLDFFGDTVANPREFPTRRIADVVSRLTNGFVGPTREIYQDRGVPYLLARHVKGNRLNFDGKTFVSESFNRKHAKSILKTGDVLLVQSGHIGASAVVPPEHEGHNCHAMIVVTPRPEMLLGHYLSHLFASPVMQRSFGGIQTGITLAHLNCRDVRELKIPLPPLDLQRDFVRCVAAMEKLEAAHRASLAGLATLFDVLQHRAFRGEL